MPDPVRALTGLIGAHESWARTKDRSARTAPARAAAHERFKKQANPDGTLSPAEEAIRAEHLRQAHMARMALLSAQSRRKAAPKAANDAA
jgi:hypothetical protein